MLQLIVSSQKPRAISIISLHLKFVNPNIMARARVERKKSLKYLWQLGIHSTPEAGQHELPQPLVRRELTTSQHAMLQAEAQHAKVGRSSNILAPLTALRCDAAGLVPMLIAGVRYEIKMNPFLAHGCADASLFVSGIKGIMFLCWKNSHSSRDPSSGFPSAVMDHDPLLSKTLKRRPAIILRARQVIRVGLNTHVSCAI